MEGQVNDSEPPTTRWQLGKPKRGTPFKKAASSAIQSPFPPGPLARHQTAATTPLTFPHYI